MCVLDCSYTSAAYQQHSQEHLILASSRNEKARDNSKVHLTYSTWPRQQPLNVEAQDPTSASRAIDVYKASVMICNSATCIHRMGVVGMIPSSQVVLQPWRFEVPP